MTLKFNVTYVIITPESAEHGDVARRGFISQNGTLRDALADLDHPDFDDALEANESPVVDPRWITAYGNMNREGEFEGRSLHFPDAMTASSKLRLCRLLGVYGA